jgi:hypothetical protein
MLNYIVKCYSEQLDGEHSVEKLPDERSRLVMFGALKTEKSLMFENNLNKKRLLSVLVSPFVLIRLSSILVILLMAGHTSAFSMYRRFYFFRLSGPFW